MEKVYKKIKNEIEKEYETKDEKENAKIIIAGDFNNNRRFTICKDWNMNRLTCESGEYTVYTPEGGSWKVNDEKYTFPLDHFITRNCEIKNYIYDKNYIKPSYSDHAMLIGTLIL